MQRPFDSVREAIFEILKQSKETTKQSLDRIDTLMVWIVGFSIGGISLIVADLSNLNQSFSYFLIKTILILLATSIISGILFRMGCYFIQIYNNQIQVFIETSFSDKEFMAMDAENLDAETDIKEVIRRLKEDFGEDASHILNEYSNATQSGKDFLLDDLKKHYIKIGAWAKRDYELAMEYAKDTLQKAYGFSENQLNKVINDNTSFKWRLWVWISFISFIVSCLTFISVIIILCVAY